MKERSLLCCKNTDTKGQNEILERIDVDLEATPRNTTTLEVPGANAITARCWVHMRTKEEMTTTAHVQRWFHLGTRNDVPEEVGWEMIPPGGYLDPSTRLGPPRGPGAKVKSSSRYRAEVSVECVSGLPRGYESAFCDHESHGEDGASLARGTIRTANTHRHRQRPGAVSSNSCCRWTGPGSHRRPLRRGEVGWGCLCTF